MYRQNKAPSVGHFGKLGLDFLKKQTTSSISSLRPVSKTGSNKATNEIFVDICEKLSVSDIFFFFKQALT